MLSQKLPGEYVYQLNIDYNDDNTGDAMSNRGQRDKHPSSH